MAVESGFYSENLGFQDCCFHHPFSLVDNNNLVHPQQTRTTQLSSSSFSSPSSSSVTFSSMAVLNSQLELQRQEIDFLLQFQKEKLRMALQEQRKQQVKALISNLETEAWRIMREKEGELAEARRKGRELEERLKKAEIEKEGWKRMANAKEAMVMGLQGKLEEARERQILVSNGAEDAASNCNYPLEAEAEAEAAAEEESGGRRSGLACKSCKNRNPCVLFLPCRHLCSCKYCEAYLGCCPVCDSVKEASVEVLLV